MPDSSSEPLVSIIILSWNTCSLLNECLNSIAKYTDGLNVETIIIDNGSIDKSQEMVKSEFPNVHLVQNKENVGFSRGNNQGVTISRGQYLLLLNSDAMLKPNTLQILVSFAQAQPKLGMVGARLINPDGSFQASYTNFPNLWQEFLILSRLGRLFNGRWYPSHGEELKNGPKKVDYVEGACMLFKREAYLEVDGLDESYFMYAEDVDLCYKLKQKEWQVWYHPMAEVIHYGGASSKNRRTKKEGDLYQSRVRFFYKYYGNLAATCLKLMIYAFTTVKIITHGILRFISMGKLGRPVIGFRDLRSKLDNINNY
jgi:N-acetylglucosaminyl-diphospho-decaprenol L-rhamnosyltransferase